MPTPTKACTGWTLRAGHIGHVQTLPGADGLDDGAGLCSDSPAAVLAAMAPRRRGVGHAGTGAGCMDYAGDTRLCGG